jgi:hypothetical protein
LKAFDLNNNGLIEQDEFVRLLDMAYRSGVDTGAFSKNANAMTGSPKKQQTVKSAKTVTMPETVKPEDRMDSKSIIDAFKLLLATENRVQDPIDDIQLIFQKIQEWKEKMAPEGKDAQEKYVAKCMKPKPGAKLKLHNIKTVN